MFNLIKHQQTTFLRVPSRFMFEIVKNVDSYCYFLPGCSRSRTFNHKLNYFEGELEIDYKLFKSSYISKVSIQQNNSQYNITSVSENNNVFKMLKSVWLITGQNENCEANYSVEFQFQNSLFQHASGLFLKEVVNSTSVAFEKRAYELFQQKQLQNEPLQQQKEDPAQIHSILKRLLQKQLINEKQFNEVKDNKEILHLAQQMQKLYVDEAVADRKCVEFINEYLLQQQQFKI